MKRLSNDEFGWNKDGFWSDEHIITSEYLLIFSMLLVCTLLTQYIVGHYWKCKNLPEAASAMLVGMTLSGIINLSGGYDNNDDGNEFNMALLSFSSNVFFFGFLPPIIFNRYCGTYYLLLFSMHCLCILCIICLAVIHLILSQFYFFIITNESNYFFHPVVFI